MGNLVSPLPPPGRIYVCPLGAVAHVVATSQASHLVTCLSGEVHVETPDAIKPGNHIRLFIHDIWEPVEGYIAPNAEHVLQLVEFAAAWDRRGPMVVHCRAGISRSTAAAFVMLCALNPAAPEALIARRLREASPSASPNRLIVKLGDAVLGRAGRMLAAVEAIGRGEIVNEAIPFSLPVDLSAPPRL